MEAYPSLDEKAATLLESLVRNRPLLDGNQRLGWLATVVFYKINGVTIEATDDDAFDLIIGVSLGEMPIKESANRMRRFHSA